MSVEDRLICFDKIGLARDKELQTVFEHWLTERQIDLDFVFRRGDVLVLPGAAWVRYDWTKIDDLVGRGVRVIGVVYDIIPVTHPEFVPGPEHVTAFKESIDVIARSRTEIVSISTAAARETEAYLKSIGLPRTVRPVPLASDLTARSAPGHASPDCAKRLGSFVLMAGSIQPRKNQMWMLRVWREFRNTVDTDTSLVFAGHYSDQAYCDELQQSRDWGEDTMLILDPSDAALRQLYRDCLFTVFPSQVEGWGLTVTEALESGKYCLAADNSSLPEAGQGLAFHASLERPDLWIDEMTRLVSDPAYLASRTERVVREFKNRSWSDVADDLLRGE